MTTESLAFKLCLDNFLNLKFLKSAPTQRQNHLLADLVVGPRRVRNRQTKEDDTSEQRCKKGRKGGHGLRSLSALGLQRATSYMWSLWRFGLVCVQSLDEGTCQDAFVLHASCII